MQIKVCGLREPANIRAVSALDVDLIGFIFWKSSQRYVKSVSIRTGLLPDVAGQAANALSNNNCKEPKKVGVFVDEMPQNIITAVFNYQLDYVQLHGEETVELIENLRRTIVPNIRPNIKFIKALNIASENDVKCWRKYDKAVDMLLFDTKGNAIGGNGSKFNWNILSAYDGTIPFLLSGGIGPNDADDILSFSHPAFAGIDLNSQFETSPGVKDIGKLRTFIEKIRNKEK